MSHADDVRAYCERIYVAPARARGQNTISIRAGDVHEGMNYRNRFPLVCAALGADLFEQQARVRRLSVDGPLNGSNTVFQFEVLP